MQDQDDSGAEAGNPGALDPDAPPFAAPGKPISDAARRALEEAAARRAAAEALARETTHEAGGPSGLEPTRFGDWEREGLAVDF